MACDALREGMRGLTALLLVGVGMSAASLASAEPPAAPDEPRAAWRFVFTPYFWAISMKGDIDARRIDADVDADFSDILDKTNIAAMVVFEARRDAWSFAMDVLFAEIEDDDAGLGPIRVDARTRQTVIDGKLGYRVLDAGTRLSLELTGGARYVRDRNEIDARLAQVGRDVDETVDWVDAVVGARFRASLADRVSLSVSGDFGGFGIGSSSDFTWSALAALSWHPWKSWSFSAGYKVLDIDRDKVDLRYHGPALGVSYRF